MEKWLMPLWGGFAAEGWGAWAGVAWVWAWGCMRVLHAWVVDWVGSGLAVVTGVWLG